MKLIVGLGNPGKKYDQTRHNIGYSIIDELAKQQSLTLQNKDDFFGYFFSDNNIKLLKPTTFMNLSGQSVSKVANYFKINPEDIIIIHDDLDIAYGQIKIQKEKSAAGHNGIISIIENLGTDKFWRLRFGISGATKDLMPGDKYVLGKFTSDEQDALPDFIKNSVDALIDFQNIGPMDTAQKFNQKS